LSEWRM